MSSRTPYRKPELSSSLTVNTLCKLNGLLTLFPSTVLCIDLHLWLVDGNLWAPGTDVPAGWDSPGSRGDLVSLLDWVWGQAMREGSHHERLWQEELKLASMGTSLPCSHGSLTILAPVLVSSGRLARRGEVHLVTRQGCSS